MKSTNNQNKAPVETKVNNTPTMSDYFKKNGTNLGQTTRKRGQN